MANNYNLTSEIIKPLIIDNKYYYSYNSIHYIIKNSYKKILKEFKPDIIIAIAGGGLIPGRIMKTYLNVPLYIVSLSLYGKYDQPNKNINVLQWINLDLQNKKVLIVDEVDDTRTTLEFCVKKLQNENNANDISVFVIHNKKKVKRGNLDDVKYFNGEEINDLWVVYPWDMV